MVISSNFNIKGTDLPTYIRLERETEGNSEMAYFFATVNILNHSQDADSRGLGWYDKKALFRQIFYLEADNISKIICHKVWKSGIGFWTTRPWILLSSGAYE